MSAPGELYRRIANGEPVGLPVPLDLRAVERHIQTNSATQGEVFALLAALRETQAALADCKRELDGLFCNDEVRKRAAGVLASVEDA